MRIFGFDSETIHGAPMTLQFFGKGVSDIMLVNDGTAEKKFFAMLDKICVKDELTVIFCHHLAFDLLSAFPTRLKELAHGYFDFSSNRWDCEGVYGRPTFAKFSQTKRRALIVDTGRFCRAGTKLEQIAADYCPDLPKLEMPQGLGEKQFSLSDTEFVRYAMRDAEIAYRFGLVIAKWHDLYNVPMSLSGPHLAAQVFRRHYVTDPVILPAREICWAALRAYHGGIQRAPYGPGYWRNTRAVDIVSAYPDAMAQAPSFTQAKLYKAYRQRGCGLVPPWGVYRVSGEARKGLLYPALHDKNFNAIPAGEFITNATGFELNEFTRQRQGLLSTVDGFYYDADKDKNNAPMRSFVLEFFRMKKEAPQKIEREAAKLLLNSLYGKFIQTRVEEEPYYDVEADSFITDISLRAGGLFNPFIAACITGHTRARLCSIERKYSAVHSATDGIISDVRDNIPVGNSLGELSIEAEGDALIVRPKLYVIYSRKSTSGNKELPASRYKPGKYVLKYALHGFRGTLETLEDMMREGRTEYEYTHVVGLKESLRTSLGRANDFIKRTGTLNVEMP